jgi:hypothetical protein
VEVVAVEGEVVEVEVVAVEVVAVEEGEVVAVEEAEAELGRRQSCSWSRCDPWRLPRAASRSSCRPFEERWWCRWHSQEGSPGTCLSVRGPT